MQPAPETGPVDPEQISSLYRELHKLAEMRLWGEHKAHSLRPTELVNEAWLRLLAGSDRKWESREQFFGTAARVMRNILVDHIRNRGANKRGGDQVRVELDDGLLDRLEGFDPTLAKIVDLRYFAGFQMQEIATLLGISLRSAEREWETARKWLFSQLK